MMVSYLGNHMSNYLESDSLGGSVGADDDSDDVARVVVKRMYNVYCFVALFVF